MGAFQYDNPLMSAMVRIANMMIVSFFWVLCCLPVVTVIPATAALFHTTAKVIRENGNGVAGDFFRALKGSLRKGLPLSLIALGSGGLLSFTLWYGWRMQQQNNFGVAYFLIGCVIALVWAAATLHLPFALSRFEGGIGMYLRMALYFAGQNPLKTLLRLVLLALVALLIDFYPIVLLILPGLYMDLICGGVEKQLQKFMADRGLAQTEEEGAGDGSNGERPASMPSLEMARLYDEPESGAEDE
jgi:uncharacterized membrane protein YesL